MSDFTMKKRVLSNGLPAIWTTKWIDGATVKAQRFDFDHSVESDGQVWVYVYAFGQRGIRRIPMGNYRKGTR